MTHGNVLATVSGVMTIVPALGSKEIYLAYLPLAHILELAAEVRVFQLHQLQTWMKPHACHSWLGFFFSLTNILYCAYFPCRM